MGERNEQIVHREGNKILKHMKKWAIAFPMREHSILKLYWDTTFHLPNCWKPNLIKTSTDTISIEDNLTVNC